MRYVAQDLSSLVGLFLTSLMELWMTRHQIPHGLEVTHDQFLGLEPEPLILHEMVSYQDIPLHVRWVSTCLRHLCCLVTFHPRHKLDSPICGDF